MDEAFVKKAFEITYAIFRVADRVYKPKFGNHLEDFGMELLKSAAFGNETEMRRAAEAIKLALQLGSGAGILNQKNTEIIIREIDGLLSAMADGSIKNDDKTIPDEDLSHIFTPLRPSEYKTSGKITSASDEIAELPDRVIQGTKESRVIIDEPDGSRKDIAVALSAVPGIGSQMRQSAILERIREMGECRMKDIQTLLPDTSERTIRYDIQDLIEQNLVERVGSSGPSTYYRLRGIAGA
ncbi:MAG TPA: DeoR family transcriptional regulator [Candidatus Paceibacterota bacterium]|nr:DeoR family transcriptional regulator [Candidatus Paceibacterota bacterium]